MQLFYQIIYNTTINPILVYFLKNIPGLPKALRLPPSGIFNFKLKNGKIIKLYTNQTCHVTKEVFWNGTSNYEYSDIFEELFEKADVFFDVGSNIGYYAVMAGITNPNISVYAFDPSPGPFRYLNENVKINNLKRVFPYKMALSNENGNFSFQAAYNSKYTFLKDNSLGGEGHLAGLREDKSPIFETVKVQTLDSFVNENQIKKIDLIKLDVEEAEHLVLEGGLNTILSMRPIVVCEVFTTDMYHKIHGFWKENEYSSYIFKEKSLKYRTYREDLEIEKIENYFFVPHEKKNWIDKFVTT